MLEQASSVCLHEWSAKGDGAGRGGNAERGPGARAEWGSYALTTTPNSRTAAGSLPARILPHPSIPPSERCSGPPAEHTGRFACLPASGVLPSAEDLPQLSPRGPAVPAGFLRGSHLGFLFCNQEEAASWLLLCFVWKADGILFIEPPPPRRKGGGERNWRSRKAAAPHFAKQRDTFCYPPPPQVGKPASWAAAGTSRL